MAYDPRCEELAAYFLEDIALSDDERARRVQEVAQAVQDCIEDLTADLRE